MLNRRLTLPLKLNPGEAEKAEKLLDGFSERLTTNAVGSIGEIFDAEAPYTPRGCVAQAWSVAEVLRSYVKIAKLKKKTKKN